MNATGLQAPLKVIEIELSDRLAGIAMRRRQPLGAYLGVLCLVRLHGCPLGLIWLEAGHGGGSGEVISRDGLAREIWSELAAPIAEHLRADGEAVPLSLPTEGLGPSEQPACVRERAAIRGRVPRATVVVATRERPESLARCLRALLALDYPDYEILVVDNAPQTSATRDLVLSEQFRTRVTYVREDRRGLAAAHNCGLARAGGELVAFTDDDVIVDRLWLLELARGFTLAERVACVTGLIVPLELETSSQLIAEQLWAWNKGFERRVFDRSTGEGDPLYPYTAGRFGSGANMAFETEALRAFGGFDPATGTGTPARGGDDLSGFFTVIAAGRRLVYNPAAIVRHANRADYPALRRQAYGYGVGLTAYLTKTVLDQPRRAVELGRVAGQGIARARNLHVVRQSRGGPLARGGRHPRLAWIERWGMLCGPIAYLRSRRLARRAAVQPGRR